MKNKVVVIASHKDDQSAMFLIKRLEELRQKAKLVNFGEFPDLHKCTIFSEHNCRSFIKLPDGYIIDNESVKSVWWRRPQGPVKSTRLSLLKKYIANECDITLASTLGFLTDSLWVSEPEATRIANRKPLQLKVARDVGFQIPLTCISNDPIEVQAFLLRNSGVDMIIKAVGSSYIRLTHSPEDKSRKNRAIYTRLINRDSFLSNIHRVSICPFILQEAIHKESDIRITVVGDRVFASEICIEQNVDPYNLDWRHHKVVRVYRSHNLPKSIIESSVKVVRSLGLRFGCIDMGYSRKTGYTFFEINPQGQWMPSEQIVGHPISLALAKLLIN